NPTFVCGKRYFIDQARIVRIEAYIVAAVCCRIRKLGIQRFGFDAILLDVDNGPDADAGLATLAAALRPGGTLSVWSASPSKAFAKALARAGFQAETVSLAARHDKGKGGRHILFLGRTTQPAAGRSRTRSSRRR